MQLVIRSLPGSSSRADVGVNFFISRRSVRKVEPPSLDGKVDPGIEIRRILVLTRLRKVSRGMTMEQIVKDCEKVPGWSASGMTMFEVVRMVLQSLIDDGLTALRTRFVLTARGREYLENPLKWRIDAATLEDVERKQFWNSIYETFDRAYRRLRSKPQTGAAKET